MPDLDRLLDTLVADVRAETRAPGASTAIRRAHRRRTVVAAASAVAVLAAGSALATGTLGGGEGTSSPVGPQTASQEPPPAQEEAFVGERYRTLREALTVPGWAITDPPVVDPMVLGRCAGNWMHGGGGAGHNLGLTSSPDDPPVAWAQEIEGFSSPAQASDAADRLIANLESCPAESWRSRPIGQTGAVLAFTDAGVLWVHQRGGSVATLHVATTDGQPPLTVQVEVADLIYSWFG